MYTRDCEMCTLNPNISVQEPLQFWFKKIAITEQKLSQKEEKLSNINFIYMLPNNWLCTQETRLNALLDLSNNKKRNKILVQ